MVSKTAKNKIDHDSHLSGALAEAVSTLQGGGYVMLLDNEDRENEGDLVMAAEFVQPEHITFMAESCRTIVCLAIHGSRLDELDIPMMVEENTSTYGTPFTRSIDIKDSRISGSSAEDRARTIKALLDDTYAADDFCSPGHVFPLRAHKKGLLERDGHTEGAVALATIARLYPAALISEVQNAEGKMMRGTELIKFARVCNAPLIHISEIKDYLLKSGFYR